MRLYAMAAAIAFFDALAAGGTETSLYIRSLAACVQAKQEVVGTLDTVFVVKNAIVIDPTFFYPAPSEVGAVRLEYLDTQSLLKRFRQTRQTFPAIGIEPMINSGVTLNVNCADYRVSVSKGRVVLSVWGGTRIHWRFDASTRDYVMTNVERWRPQM